MINPEHKLSLTKQANALGISRGSVYYLPRPVSERDQALMKRIDRLHLEFPFAGARMLRDLLNQEGFKLGRKHVRTLMRIMGVEAIYCKPRTTKRNPAHRIYPYLLRGLPITRSNQVVGDGHHLHPDGSWICLSHRGYGLVFAAGTVVPGLDHDGHQLLPGRARRGHRKIRQA